VDAHAHNNMGEKMRKQTQQNKHKMVRLTRRLATIGVAVGTIMAGVGLATPQAQASDIWQLNRPGVILVTLDPIGTSIGSVPYTEGIGHAGMVYGAGITVEGAREGVVTRSNNWEYRYWTVFGINVSGTSAADDAEAVEWAMSQINKPYNWNFFNIETQSEYYCSQLVWRAFERHGVDLNTWLYDYSWWGRAIAPVELVTSPHTYLIYQKG